MNFSDPNQKNLARQTLDAGISPEKIRAYARSRAFPYRELMAYYQCAIMEVTTKFNVLNEELSLEYDRNPIETIKSRLKSPESIMEKMQRKGLPFTVDSIEQNIMDVAGVRVICSFPSDIYALSDMFLRQDDIRLVEKKDYIKSPKSNGYRSLHLIVEIPIFLHNSKKLMKLEVQFRTISMDWWASLEHKIRYKKDYSMTKEMEDDLLDCANRSAMLDMRMESIYKTVENRNNNTD